MCSYMLTCNIEKVSVITYITLNIEGEQLLSHTVALYISNESVITYVNTLNGECMCCHIC